MGISSDGEEGYRAGLWATIERPPHTGESATGNQTISHLKIQKCKSKMWKGKQTEGKMEINPNWGSPAWPVVVSHSHRLLSWKVSGHHHDGRYRQGGKDSDDALSRAQASEEGKHELSKSSWVLPYSMQLIHFS